MAVLSPTDKFDPSDPIHFSGTKTFEFVLIAKQERTQTPGLKFTYLDPVTGKYETLTQAPFVVEAKAGEVAPTPSPVADSSPLATPKPELSPLTPVSHDDGDSSWKPLFKQPVFLWVNLFVALFWVLALIYFLIKKSPVRSSCRKSGGNSYPRSDCRISDL